MPPMRTPDGIELYVRHWPVPDGTPQRGRALIVHGLGEHSGRYEHVADALAAIGLDVTAYDQRGHGRSEGVRGGLPHSDALLDDLRLVYDTLGEPAFLVGHSMGGLVAARAVTGGWVQPRALVVSSPVLAVELTPVQRALAVVGRRFLRDTPLPNRLPVDKLSHDPAVVADYKADPLVHDRITSRLFEFMLAAGESARADAPALRTPTLGLVAGADAFLDPGGSRAFFAALPDGTGTLHWYDELWHEVLNEREPDRSRVIGGLTGWLEERLA
jgi:alpha-beta hydrolase superfamily lysophospholipase